MKKEKTPQKERMIEPYWKELVSVYFDFCKDKFNEIPSFDGSAPRDMKTLISTLRIRAESNGVEWNHETATTRLRSFLEYSFADKWLQENWLVSNINRQKDKIFFKIAQQRK